MAQPLQLVVDLGTCHTVAVVRRPGEAPRPVLFDGSPLLPSGVYRDLDGTLTVGRDAERLAGLAPNRFEPYPKRTVDDGGVLLGDTETPVVDLFAAILRRVLAETGPAAAVTLTCPADWGMPRRQVLLAAARVAGIGTVRLVDEPIAAATFCVEVLGQRLAPGQSLLVFDFGGGTLDVAVVRREAGDTLRVLSVGGLDDLGGVDVDAALVGHLGQLISLRSPEAWRRLIDPHGTGEQRERQTFWAAVRGAKEMLSRSASAPVPVPGTDDAVHLTREELERVAGPLVDRAVDETRRVLERSGLPTGTLAGILLVGGSSRIPLVASRLHARFGVAPTVPEQPELPVAFGAVLITAPPPPTPPPPPSPPVSPGPAVHFGQPAPGWRPPAPTPVPAPGWRPPAPVSAPVPVPPAGRARPRGPVLALVLVLLAVLGLGGYAAFQAIGKAGNLGGGAATGPNGASVGWTPFGGSPVALAGATAGVAIGRDSVFYLVAGVESSDVYAVGLPGTKGAAWHVKVPVAPATVALTVVGDLLVVDGEKSATDANQDVRAVLLAQSGKLLWKHAWENRSDVSYVGTDAIVDEDFPLQTQRVNLRTGVARWTHPKPEDVTIADHRVKPALLWSAPSGGPVAVPAPVGGVFQESLAVDGSKVVEVNDEDGSAYVLNAVNGHPVVHATVGLSDDLLDTTWVAFDGLVLGQPKDGRPSITAYSLVNLKKMWAYNLPAGADTKRIKPCGVHLVCVAIEVNNDPQVLAVNTTNGSKVWSQSLAADSIAEPGWYVLGGRVLYGDNSFISLGNSSLPLSTLDTSTGRATRLGDTKVISMQAAAGRSGALLGFDASGEKWLVAVRDVVADRQTAWLSVGKQDRQPVLAVSGDTVAAICAGKLYLARATGLSGH